MEFSPKMYFFLSFHASELLEWGQTQSALQQNFYWFPLENRASSTFYSAQRSQTISSRRRPMENFEKNRLQTLQWKKKNSEAISLHDARFYSSPRGAAQEWTFFLLASNVFLPSMCALNSGGKTPQLSINRATAFRAVWNVSEFHLKSEKLKHGLNLIMENTAWNALKLNIYKLRRAFVRLFTRDFGAEFKFVLTSALDGFVERAISSSARPKSFFLQLKLFISCEHCGECTEHLHKRKVFLIWV